MYRGKKTRAKIQEPDSTTSSVTTSLDLKTLNNIAEFRARKGFTRSYAMRTLIKYGLIYDEMLERGYFEKQHEKPKDDS